jgi:hypothetical protein
MPHANTPANPDANNDGYSNSWTFGYTDCYGMRQPGVNGKLRRRSCASFALRLGSDYGSGDPDMWVTSTTNPDTAPNDAFIIDEDGISDKYLDTPGILITSSAAQLRFRNNFNTEFSGWHLLGWRRAGSFLA